MSLCFLGRQNRILFILMHPRHNLSTTLSHLVTYGHVIQMEFSHQKSISSFKQALNGFLKAQICFNSKSASFLGHENRIYDLCQEPIHFFTIRHAWSCDTNCICLRPILQGAMTRVRRAPRSQVLQTRNLNRSEILVD